MLALTKKTGYGLIAMAHLSRLDRGRLASAREIAEQFGVPTALLMNVMKKLAAAGYVESVRGAHGGYRLVRGLDEVTLADLVTAMEGPIRLAECISGHSSDRPSGVCRIMDHCPVADPIHRVQRKLSDFLRQVSLTDITRPLAAKPRETHEHKART